MVMRKEDEESDEDETFLHSSLEILDGLFRGDEVSSLAEHLKKPTHSFDSDATDCIYNALKVITKQSQNNSLNSLCPSLASSPTPDKFVDSSGNDLVLDESARGDTLERSELCISPTKQIGKLFDQQQNSTTFGPIVPRLNLEFSPTSSVHHSPSLTNREDFIPFDAARLRLNLREFSHCCHQCHNESNSLNLTDFLYLFLFGLGMALIFYYLYIPPLYKGPVF